MTDRQEAVPSVAFGLSHIPLAIHAFLAVLLFGLGINGIVIVLLDPKTDPTLWWMAALVIAFCMIYPPYIGTYVVMRWCNRAPPIRIGPDGLLDRGLTDRPIPWSAFKSVRIVRTGGRAPGTHFMFDLQPGRSDVPPFKFFARVTTVLNRAMGFPAHQVWCLGTDASVDKLVAASEPYVPIEGRA
jgi:hypothetical protein